MTNNNGNDGTIAHFDVVRLAREKEQRFVLRLPAEPRDRAVIAVVVGHAGDGAARNVEVRSAFDSQRLLLGRVARTVGRDRRIGNLFDQPCPEGRGGNAEDHVVVRELGREVRLRERAGIRAGPTRDGEQSVDAAVGRSVGIQHEARFTHRSVCRDERGNSVGSAVLSSEGHLRIDERAGAAERGLDMASAAAVEVHSRPEAIRNLFLFGKIHRARGEERGLGPAQSRELPAGACGAAANAGVAGVEGPATPLRRGHFDLKKEQARDCCRQSQRHNKLALHSRFLVNQQYELRERRANAASSDCRNRFSLRYASSVLQKATSVPLRPRLRMPCHFKEVAQIPRGGLRRKRRGGTTEDRAIWTNDLIRRCLKRRRSATRSGSHAPNGWRTMRTPTPNGARNRSTSWRLKRQRRTSPRRCDSSGILSSNRPCRSRSSATTFTNRGSSPTRRSSASRICASTSTILSSIWTSCRSSIADDS